MFRLRGLVCVCGLTLLLTVVSATAASAATFYVSTTGKDTNACTEPASPCKTIAKAVTDSELVPGAATIDIAAGTYEEGIHLDKAADDGLTINGAGSGAGGTTLQPSTAATEATMHLTVPGAAITLSNVGVVNVSGNTQDGLISASETTLNNVTFDMRNAGDDPAVVQEEVGSLVMNGGGVTMESGAEGVAIGSEFDPLTVNNAYVTVANGSKAAGIESEYAPLSLDNTSLILGNTAGIAVEATAAPTSLTGVSVIDGSEKEPGIAFALPKSLLINGVHVTMTSSKDSSPGALLEFGSTTSVLEGLDVSGAWNGPAFEDSLGNVTIRDSRLIASATGTDPAVLYEGDSEGPGLLLQRSVIQAAPTAPNALEALASNVTLDSSELLGGKDGLYFDQAAGKERTLTVSASTIDAGNLGEAGEPEVAAVDVAATGSETGSVAVARIVGSILLEPQLATIEAGSKGTASVGCSYSDVPSQTQAATASEGSIACAAGATGNTSSEVKALFSEPLTSYQLIPSSSAVDSVPVSAISLPFGFTASSTDLAGNPRSEGVACNQLQDKGALELQGHATSCPAPPSSPPATTPTPKPLAGVISALTISPSVFLAAPAGATISATAAGKAKYGAKVSYRDSQAAKTTFTVLGASTGRRQGKSCKKPSNANKHGKRCTILTALGSFSHTDIAGANSVHFSGRLKGKKLPAGSYELQLVPHDAAGNGLAVEKGFKIET
jgi:hypothetical protein